MMLFLCVIAAYAATSFAENTVHIAPKVQVYSYKPGRFGEDNVLICHVSGFHPPDITIQLMKDDMEIPQAKQTDLAFKQDWHFHLTKTVTFNPKEGEKFSCKVTHGKDMKDYAWEANM